MEINKKESSNYSQMSDDLQTNEVVLQDAEVLFTWANEAEVRANSINEKSIEWAEHLVWFKSKMLDSTYQMNWYQLASKKVGLVRIQIEPKHALLSIQIHKDQRGKGRGKSILQAATNDFFKKYQLEIHAEVLSDNMASRRLFTSCGYQEISVRAVGERNFVQFVLGPKDLKI